MTSLKLFGAAALVSVAFATQAFAQAAVQEPGAFAFYHPDADVLGGRRPPAEAMAALPAPGLRLSVRPHRAHHTSSRRAF